MLTLQLSIGALNDVVDAPYDVDRKPGKPLPAGVVSQGPAISLAGGGLLVGLFLSAPSGAPTVAVAAAGAALGYLYDVWLSRSSLSWLPLSLALPLVPIHAWLGSTGTVPPGLLSLVPAAILAGAALALANGLVDLERDAGSGRHGIAVRLGFPRAWALQTGLLAVVAAMALLIAPGVPPLPAGGHLPAPGGPPGLPGSAVLGLEALRLVRLAGIGMGLVLLAIGSVALGSRRPAIRERGWELEAIGVAGLGIGWLTGAASGGAEGP
jgi:4-hydroxybenzoate polyprenyltransferase